MKRTIQKIKSKQMDAILRIQTSMLKAIHDFMSKKEVIQLMPVILSPITDPLCHSVFDAEIKYYKQKFQLTKSMIIHKQVSLISEDRKGIYIISPNIRLEKRSYKETGRHLIEFSQVDFEFKDAKKEDIIRFMEELTAYVLTKVKKECKKDLKKLQRELKIPKTPFKVHYKKELIEKYGKDFEEIMSKKSKVPFWVLDHDREFYDKEDMEKPESYLNYDLVWPEGYGEALSGGEREHEYEQIVRRMKRRKMKLSAYKQYLELAKKRMLPRTAGAGFGVERMLRYICGKKQIRDVTLFAKMPGTKIAF